MDKTTIAISGSLTVAIVALILALNPLLINSDKTYVCLEPKMVMECSKVSNVNKDGLITRCYYIPEGEKETYKTCLTGWVKYEKIIGDIQLINNDTYFICDNTQGLIKECSELNGTRTLLKVSVK